MASVPSPGIVLFGVIGPEAKRDPSLLVKLGISAILYGDTDLVQMLTPSLNQLSDSDLNSIEQSIRGQEISHEMRELISRDLRAPIRTQISAPSSVEPFSLEDAIGTFITVPFPELKEKDVVAKFRNLAGHVADLSNILLENTRQFYSRGQETYYLNLGTRTVLINATTLDRLYNVLDAAFARAIPQYFTQNCPSASAADKSRFFNLSSSAKFALGELYRDYRQFYQEGRSFTIQRQGKEVTITGPALQEFRHSLDRVVRSDIPQSFVTLCSGARTQLSSFAANLSNEVDQALRGVTEAVDRIVSMWPNVSSATVAEVFSNTPYEQRFTKLVGQSATAAQVAQALQLPGATSSGFVIPPVVTRESGDGFMTPRCPPGQVYGFNPRTREHECYSPRRGYDGAPDWT